MSLKDMIAADNKNVFMNTSEFAEERTVIYDGTTYTDIPIIMSGLKEQGRRQLQDDHAQGLFLVSAVLHCAADSMDGRLPEKLQRIKVNDQEGGGGFFREFIVASSACEMGMFRIELEAIDE